MTAFASPSANTIAQEMTGRDYISFSAISTFCQCPLKYAFKYIEGLTEETVSSNLVFGRGVHAAAEHHFNELMSGAPAPDQESLLTAFWDAWRCAAEEGAIKFGKGEDHATMHQLADRVLSAFWVSDLAQPVGRVIGVEEELRGNLVPGVPDFLARIDLLIETDDALIVRDFKTSRSRWREGQAENQAEQLLLYSELARQLAPGKPLRLEFAVFTKTKVPTVELHSVIHDPRRISRTKRIIERVWQAIESRLYYPSPSAMNCPGCPFRKPCRAWQG
jgi:putative RecB family exonuclease